MLGIFENVSGDYYWLENIDGEEIKKAKYFCEKNDEGGTFHACIKSALYDDMTGYVDELQDEEFLADDELYVVLYYSFDENYCGLDQCVDFGITKQEIIDNVKAQKYIEGADYLTMGQMFYTMRKTMEEIQA